MSAFLSAWRHWCLMVFYSQRDEVTNSSFEYKLAFRRHYRSGKTCSLWGFSCPDNSRAFPVIKKLQSKFGKNLTVVFRNFPLMQIHPNALSAAHAVEAAGLQGKFWQMHDILFECWERLSPRHLLEYALKIGLDLEKFQADMNSTIVSNYVKEDLKSGIDSGVHGTPTIFINDEKCEDDCDDFERLAQVISKVLTSRERKKVLL